MKSTTTNRRNPHIFANIILYFSMLLIPFLLSCDREGPAKKDSVTDQGGMHLKRRAPGIYRLENSSGTEFVDVWANDGKVNMVGYTNNSIDTNEYGFTVIVDFRTRMVTDIDILDKLIYSYTVENGVIGPDPEVLTHEELNSPFIRYMPDAPK